MKITEDIVANFLCFLLDKYESQPLDEAKLREVGQEFLESDYNKSDALEDDIKERIEKWKNFHQFSYKEGYAIVDILSAQIEALDSDNKMLRGRLGTIQEIWEK